MMEGVREDMMEWVEEVDRMVGRGEERGGKIAVIRLNS